MKPVKNQINILTTKYKTTYVKKIPPKKHKKATIKSKYQINKNSQQQTNTTTNEQTSHNTKRCTKRI